MFDINGWIDPDKLLPDRCGDYRVKLAGKDKPETSRFNKRLLYSYWSIEHFCHEKVIGWKPALSWYLQEGA